MEGRIASFYYLAHTTLQHLRDSLKEDMTTEEVLQTLVDATEFAQLPVRHNEDNINSELAKQCPLKVNIYTMDSPNTKTRLDYALYVMSDCYLGLDQQFSLPLQVEPAGEKIFYSDEE